jgi:hypothetical protein
MAQRIDDYLTQYYTVDGPAEGIQFYGEKPVVSGFPFAPVVTYKDGFEKDNVLIYFDTLIISGFPIPSLPIMIEASGDIQLVNQNIKEKIKADKIDLKFIMPRYFPRSAQKQDIAQWQQDVGTVEIMGADFINSEVNIHGEGLLGLDQNLQLSSHLKTKTYGYESAINFFVGLGTVKPFVGALAISGLNSIALTDPTTYKNYVELTIMVKNRELFFGPIKIDSLPQIEWL